MAYYITDACAKCGTCAVSCPHGIISEGDEPELELTYVSPDMEENYPGTLTVKTYYKLTCDAGLSIRFVAETDKPTIVNLTNHAYYNLAGYESGTILDQVMWIDSDKINEQDVELIPTGNFVNVEGTAYDFRSAKAIGRDFNSEPSMSIQNGGYDNNYIINGADGKKYFAHTLNNTVVAPPRMLIAFLENNLNADGTVNIPEVLRPYMGGKSKIG